MSSSLTFYGGEKAGPEISKKGENEDRKVRLDLEVPADLFKTWTEVEIFAQYPEKSLSAPQLQRSLGADLARAVDGSNPNIRVQVRIVRVFAKNAENGQSREQLLRIRLGVKPVLRVREPFGVQATQKLTKSNSLRGFRLGRIFGLNDLLPNWDSFCRPDA